MLKTTLLNPPPIGQTRFIREGRCMQSVDSWAAIWPPLTLAVLASIARRHGPIDLFDCNVEEEPDIAATARRVRAFAPDVIVVNTAFPSIEADNACAAALKEACPGALVVGFGVFFTLLEKRALEACPAFDVGIAGEPEVTFAEWMECLAAGRPGAGLPGLIWREETGIAAGPPRPVLEHLDELPLAARDLLRNERYRLPHNGRPFTLINVARGCPYPCTYCIVPAYYGRKPRRHSLEYVLGELELCQKELGLGDFLFWEEAFTLDKTFGLELCSAIRAKGWKISWAATTRADLVDAEILTAMKEAGCMLLGLGIESGHQPILDAAKKRESVEDIRRAVALCRQVGLKTMGHFIFGLPGETPLTARQTREFGLKLGLDYLQCYCAVPYPKTELGDLARERGWIRSERWADFDFGGHSILDVGTISPEEVDQARNALFRAFYLRPGFILKQIGTLLAHPRQALQINRFISWMTVKK